MRVLLALVAALHLVAANVGTFFCIVPGPSHSLDPSYTRAHDTGVSCARFPRASRAPGRAFSSRLFFPPLAHSRLGTSEHRIISGTAVNPSVFPQIRWQVYFRSGSSACGGSIIGDQWVITAGHCVRSISGNSQTTTPASSMRVTPGTSTGGASIQVAEFWAHPSYGSGTSAVNRVDMAILRLASNITFTSTVQPIALAASTCVTCELDGTTAFVSGYGNTQSSSSGTNSVPSSTLLFVNQRVTNLGTCNGASPFTIPRSAFCAGDPDGCTVAPCKDSCTGDSGGPVAVNLGSQAAPDWVLTGVVQSGTVVNNENLPLCGAPNEFGIYTSIKSERTWIDSVLAGTAGPPTDNTQGGGGSNFLLCFHEESLVSYKGRPAQPMTRFAQGAEAECVVPHTFQADGVRVDTDCAATPLRLSKEHLVFAAAGLVQAHTLRAGDKLWRDVAQTAQCSVLRVSADPGQRYMGLNCYESVVVADGVLVSTFESQHTVAALWMKYMPTLLGLRGASKVGEVLTNIFRALHIA